MRGGDGRIYTLKLLIVYIVNFTRIKNRSKGPEKSLWSIEWIVNMINGQG